MRRQGQPSGRLALADAEKRREKQLIPGDTDMPFPFVAATPPRVWPHYLALLLLLWSGACGHAHDTWVQTNTNVIRTGDAIHIDLMLGNHGNDHRDFKLASKLAGEHIQTFEVVGPDGKRWDLKPTMVDLGYDPKEGFWSAKFVPAQPGLYVAAQTTDRVLPYGEKPYRGIKCGKTYFVVSPSLDKVASSNPGFDKPLGHRLELVPEANPVTPMGPGTPLKLKLLFAGKPLPGIKVSFIPRGVKLKDGMDNEHERVTDKEGQVAFTPRTGTFFLVVAHYDRPDEKGKDYDKTKYSATLTVLVPQFCPCCGE
jgi:uncharacterized GH25 family protein